MHRKIAISSPFESLIRGIVVTCCQTSMDSEEEGEKDLLYWKWRLGRYVRLQVLYGAFYELKKSTLTEVNSYSKSEILPTGGLGVLCNFLLLCMACLNGVMQQ